MRGVIVLFLCGSVLPAQTGPIVEKARQAEASGNYESALQLYEEARTAARAAKQNTAEAAAILNAARVAENLAAGAPAQEARLSEALRSYEEVARIGNPAQKLTAALSRSNLLLQLGRAAEAVQVCRQMDLSTVNPARRYYYESRFALALEKNGNLQEAYNRYFTAVTQRPSYKPAVEGAARILLTSGPAKTPDAVKLGTLLLSHNQTELAGPQIRAFLVKWAGEPSANRLLALLLQYYVATSLPPPDFQESERAFLTGIGDRAPQLKRAVGDIELAYGDGLLPSLAPEAVRQLFQGWTTGNQEPAFSALLKSIGDYHDRGERPALALARYYSAWAVDNTNTTAALYAATTLRDHTHELDPDGRVFDQLIDSFFSAKGVSYQKGDWPNILRMHLVLSEIFERVGKWGSESQPRTVIFQLTQALRAEKQVQQGFRDFPPSPGLYERLGNAYRQTGRTAEAWEAYMTAAEGFVQYLNADAAIRVLDLAKKLNMRPKPEDAERLKYLETEIGKLPKEPAPPDPVVDPGTRDPAKPPRKPLPPVPIDKELSPDGKKP